ncbi:MAG: S8 family serine peptidase [Bdellovibrionales bacterium]|nr:S8 family serine peptidase [Bdellovibrionales bacterium]
MKKLLSVLTISYVMMLTAYSAAWAQKPIAHEENDFTPQSYSIDLEALSNDLGNILDEKNENLIRNFAAQVAQKLQDRLDQYDVQNIPLKVKYLGIIAQCSLVQNDFEAFEENNAKEMKLEEKIGLQVTKQILARAYAQSQIKNEDFGQTWQNLLDGISNHYASAKPELLVLRGRLKNVAPLERIKATLSGPRSQIAVKQKGELDLGTAEAVIRVYTYATIFEPNASIAFDILKDYIVKQDKDYESKNVYSRLTLQDDLITFKYPKSENKKFEIQQLKNTPSTTLVAVLDYGLDVDIFRRDQIWTNPLETYNEEDSDDNGFVDDVHGPTFEPSTAVSKALIPTETDGAIGTDRIKQIEKLFLGNIDLYNLGIDSQEAADYTTYVRSIARDKKATEEFKVDLTFFPSYIHGTHIASLISRNPHAVMMSARMPVVRASIPPQITESSVLETTDHFKKMVQYFSEHQVRIVNLSSKWSLDEFESNLRSNGVSSEKAKETSAELFAIYSDGMYEAIKNASEILFVVAAGNQNNDTTQVSVIPSGFDLPNIITVSATDAAGTITDFSNTGKVDLYADGYLIYGLMPGGTPVYLSGTSMATALVSEAASKLLSLDSKLTPKKTKALLIKNARKGTTDKGEKINLLDPVASAKALLK